VGSVCVDLRFARSLRGRRHGARVPHPGTLASGIPLAPRPYVCVRSDHHWRAVLCNGTSTRTGSRPGPAHRLDSGSVLHRAIAESLIRCWSTCTRWIGGDRTWRDRSTRRVYAASGQRLIDDSAARKAHLSDVDPSLTGFRNVFPIAATNSRHNDYKLNTSSSIPTSRGA